MHLLIFLALQSLAPSFADSMVDGGEGDSASAAAPRDTTSGTKQFECKTNGGSISFLFKRGAGFVIERSSASANSPDMDKRLAGLPPELANKLRGQMAEMDKPQPAFDKCSRMQDCKFGRPGDRQIVLCSDGSGNERRKLEFNLLGGGTYQATCLSAEAGNFTQDSLKIKGEKTSSSTYQDTFALNACRAPSP